MPYLHAVVEVAVLPFVTHIQVLLLYLLICV